MDEKELVVLAEKVKTGTATEEEVKTFNEEINTLLSDIEGILEKK